MAADQGDGLAQHNVGNCYYEGQGVAQSYEKACEWYQKAADQGLAVAQYNLGQCYEKGVGVAKSLKKAKRLYKLAAKQGHAPSHAALARLEAAPGKDADVQKAQKHIRSAQAAMAADGSDDAYSGLIRSVTQHFLKDANLVSLLRCANEGCSVA